MLADFRAALDDVTLVDVVTPTEQHVDLCIAAIEAGKDVFVEKPLTLQVEAAQKLAAVVARSDRILHVGDYFRHHPLARYARERVTAGDLGSLRYLSGGFYGLKRARADIGVTANDAVHFLDLFSWLMGSAPVEVFAVHRDHFGRGLEDLALVGSPIQTAGSPSSRQLHPARPPAGHRDAERAHHQDHGGLRQRGRARDRLSGRAPERHRPRHERHGDGSWHPVFGDALCPSSSRAARSTSLRANSRNSSAM